MMSDSETDAIIIREHARLHVQVMHLPKVTGVGGEEYIKRDDVIALLYLSEANIKAVRVEIGSARPQNSPKKRKAKH